MADVKYNRIIEISSPNYPKIDTHNDILSIFLQFWCDGGRRVILGRSAGEKSNVIIEISGPNYPKIDTHNDTYLSSHWNFGATAGGGGVDERRRW